MTIRKRTRAMLAVALLFALAHLLADCRRQEPPRNRDQATPAKVENEIIMERAKCLLLTIGG